MQLSDLLPLSQPPVLDREAEPAGREGDRPLQIRHTVVLPVKDVHVRRVA